ncbi:MAG: hypothetical protein K8R53_02425 [Bacteroidales bacterium]|nr:hypothetical protein [Bacteroidales bacterium]
MGKSSASSFPYSYNWNTSNEILGYHIVTFGLLQSTALLTKNGIGVRVTITIKFIGTTTIMMLDTVSGA